jgi:flagellar biosynthesis/type III secretory pathway M-ring protein FliF/YscJ
VRNRFSPPISLKQLEDVLQEEWYKIPLETVQNMYESSPRRIAAVLKVKFGPSPY